MPKATFSESAVCTASHYYTGDFFFPLFYIEKN